MVWILLPLVPAHRCGAELLGFGLQTVSEWGCRWWGGVDTSTQESWPHSQKPHFELAPLSPLINFFNFCIAMPLGTGTIHLYHRDNSNKSPSYFSHDVPGTSVGIHSGSSILWYRYPHRKHHFQYMYQEKERRKKEEKSTFCFLLLLLGHY